MKSSKELRDYKTKLKSNKRVTFSELLAKSLLIEQGVDHKFQMIVGFYIVDFFITNKCLVVEIDGSSHNDKEWYDAQRDHFLKKCGYKVLRIKNEEAASIIEKISLYEDIDNWEIKFKSGLGKANALRGKSMVYVGIKSTRSHEVTELIESL